MNKTQLVMIMFAMLVAWSRCEEETTLSMDEDTTAEPPKYTITHEVFFDIEVRPTKTSEAVKSGRIVIGLFGDICPMTATNFAQLAKGFKRENVKIQTHTLFFHTLSLNFILNSFKFKEKVLVQTQSDSSNCTRLCYSRR